MTLKIVVILILAVSLMAEARFYGQNLRNRRINYETQHTSNEENTENEGGSGSSVDSGFYNGNYGGSSHGQNFNDEGHGSNSDGQVFDKTTADTTDEPADDMSNLAGHDSVDESDHETFDKSEQKDFANSGEKTFYKNDYDNSDHHVTVGSSVHDKNAGKGFDTSDKTTSGTGGEAVLDKGGNAASCKKYMLEQQKKRKLFIAFLEDLIEQMKAKETQLNNGEDKPAGSGEAVKKICQEMCVKKDHRHEDETGQGHEENDDDDVDDYVADDGGKKSKKKDGKKKSKKGGKTKDRKSKGRKRKSKAKADISEEDEENVAGPPTGVDEEDKFYTEPPIDGNDDVYTRPPIDDDEEEEEDIYGGPQTTEGPDEEELDLGNIRRALKSLD